MQHEAGDTISSEMSPHRTSCGSCVNTSAMQQQLIISMEEDEMSDQEVVSIGLLAVTPSANKIHTNA